jgi:hypothetical protein
MATDIQQLVDTVKLARVFEKAVTIHLTENTQLVDIIEAQTSAEEMQEFNSLHDGFEAPTGPLKETCMNYELKYIDKIIELAQRALPDHDLLELVAPEVREKLAAPDVNAVLAGHQGPILAALVTQSPRLA